MTPANKLVVIDPSSDAYYHDRLFDVTNVALNRDDTLAPFIRMKAALEAGGAVVHTADWLATHAEQSDYYSLGVLANLPMVRDRPDIKPKAFLVMEPPVVDPAIYRALPELTKVFDEVYVHNTSGDGYSLADVDVSKLRKLYWPQPRADVIDGLWDKTQRMRRIVVINGNHKPASFERELYSLRIEAMRALAPSGCIDLYGRGWERWWSRASFWAPYWLNRRAIMSIYKGSCSSKYEVMSDYAFSLCFENMAMKGYVTEKIFDCFYAGTVPLYLGATDIENLVPAEAFVDCRRFKSWNAMLDEVMAMSEERIENMREAGRSFIRSATGLMYFNSLNSITD